MHRAVEYWKKEAFRNGFIYRTYLYKMDNGSFFESRSKKENKPLSLWEWEYSSDATGFYDGNWQEHFRFNFDRQCFEKV